MFGEVDCFHVYNDILIAQAGIRTVLLASIVSEGHGFDVVVVGLINDDAE